MKTIKQFLATILTLSIVSCLTTFFMTLSYHSYGQTIPHLSIEFPKDTSSPKINYYPDRFNPIPKSKRPLIIFNEKKFKNFDFSNTFFDFSNVLSVNEIYLKNDSSKLYGKAGRNGIIVIKTKYEINWVSSTQILRQHANRLFHSQKNTILKINGFFYDLTE